MKTRIFQITLAAIILSGCASTALAAPATLTANPCAALRNAQQTRCYWARGFFWNGSRFVYEYRGQQPRFVDERVYAEVLAEYGITLQNDDKNWTTQELNIVTTAVVKLAARLGGIEGSARLKTLLGNTTVTFMRRSHSKLYPSATAERYDDQIRLHDEAFANRTRAQVYGTVIHELAHIIGDINYTPDGELLKEAFPYLPNGMGLVAPRTTLAGDPEYFAEGVKLWVITDYPTAWKLDAKVQGAWLDEMLEVGR